MLLKKLMQTNKLENILFFMRDMIIYHIVLLNYLLTLIYINIK
jgi:hypothetical protein